MRIHKVKLLFGNLQHSKLPVKIERFKVKDIAIDTFGILIIDINDDVWFSDVENIYSKIEGIKGKSVAIGDSHGAIIDNDDNLWMFGDMTRQNLEFSLNIPDEDYCKYRNIIEQLREKIKIVFLLNNIRIKLVALGTYNTAIIDMDNNVLMWGRIFNTRIPTLIQNVKGKQIAIGYNQLLVLDFDGNVLQIGLNNAKELTLIPEIKRDIYVREISIQG